MERFFTLMLSILLGISSLSAQNPTPIIQQFLEQNYIQQQLAKSDIVNWEITSHHKSSTSGLLHVYIQQTHQGIKIANGIANFAIKDKNVISMGNRLVSNVAQKAIYKTPKLSPTQAIQAAVQQLGIQATSDLKIINAIGKQHFIYNNGNISKENIPVKLMYYATDDDALALVWDLSIYTLDAQHWWSIKIDAQTGQIINKNDQIIRCNFDHTNFKRQKRTTSPTTFFSQNQAPQTISQPDQYTVFPLPIESPNHGARSIVTNPSNSTASPFGWHDTNGIIGSEYTITKGNNVYAYEDTSNNNNPGFSPDGGTSLEFNFPYTPSSAPHSYQAAAITNLFYTTNMMHDVWYLYGFDEASGNFQSNNYSNGGLAGDYLLAEAQDSRGSNDAVMIAPIDGNNPRMEMFLWNINVGNYLTINSPSVIARSYNAGGSTFGSALSSTPITANVVLVEDATFPINNACEMIINGADVMGKIALIQGDNVCSATTKVEMAQNAGAIAAIVISSSSTPTQMTGTNGNVTIPSIQVSAEDGDSIKTQLLLGPVSASISTGSTTYYPEDSDMDNGIIAHEYGHGISNRLTGGANSSTCLNNREQMGEGWSDWFALMMTIEPGDSGADPRGFATYPSRQATTGKGLRPAPYSTDFSINPYTYGSSNNVATFSEPHGVGFIYGTVLWDLTWALIDEYGGTPDPDLYNGTGGNNIAMHLVIESLKLQPCHPGMIDGRDAILTADSILYNGAHQCLIWRTFAARGFGKYANQGSSNDRQDQTQDFTVPLPCQIPTTPPIAAFSYSSTASCIKTVTFTDNSSHIAQSWQWDFGDGKYSNQQNPIHNYDTAGTYLVRLISSNSVGNDTITHSIVITDLPTPIANDITFCSGDSIIIPVTATGSIQWTDTANQIISTDNLLSIPNGTNTQTYYVQSFVEPDSQYIGPPNKAFGNWATISGPASFRALNFRADNKFRIISAKVYTNIAANRTFYLVKGTNNTGNYPSGSDIVDSKVIYIPSGNNQRIDLNFIVPDTGYYNIGGVNNGLIYEASDVDYPYILNGYMRIDSSSSPSFPTDHYYSLYDIEIRDLACSSPIDTVTATPISSNFSFMSTGGTVNFTDVSIGATSWLWDFGDNNTSAQQNPTHTYTSSGNYTVTLTINNGTCRNTQTLSIVLGTHSVAKPLPKIKLSPNPAKKATSLLLEQAISEDLAIQFVDINGKTVLQKMILPAGATKLDLNLAPLPAAIYFVRIKGSNFVDTRKLVVK